jgi:DNA (cytosine-5)-methyltransferase 1
MHLLGYRHKCVYLNSQFCHPTPQSRDRMYVVFWKKGNKEPMLDFRPAARCSRCNSEVKAIQRWKNPQKQYGKYRKQYIYVCPNCASEVTPYFYAAFNCIDWSDIGTRIGDRKNPLNENTIRRVEYGLKKYGNQSLIIHAGYSKEARGVERSLLEPAFTQTSIASQALVHPFIINNQHSTGVGYRVKGVEETIPTILTEHHLSLCMPFILKEEHTKHIDYLRSVEEPLMTQSTRQSMELITPFIVEMKKTSNARGITDPLSTMTSVAYHGLVSTESWKSFLSYFYGQDQASGMDEPIGTVSTRDRFAIVNYKEPSVEDCYFRMLRPPEVKLAMAFDKDYVILGNQKDQVKQCGNAVTPPAMEWLVGQGVDSLQ